MPFGRTSAHDRVIGSVAAHAASMLRVARQHSLCADDAQDAYQRALEIYLERLDEVDEATEGAWLRTVCKHEAMRIRDQRQRVLPSEDVVWDLHLAADDREAVERAASLERVARAAEALQGCKPDEATAMLLKADGSSYAEIGELTGWTYTKVNRCLTEGRARFLARFSAIDSGAACADWAPLLSAIVDGHASERDLARVRPHLRHCAACRATLKGLYESQPALGALVPAGLVAAEPSGVVARAYEALVTGLGDRIARVHAMIEVATSSKAAAVVASTAAVAAGGAATVDRLDERPSPRRAAVAEAAPRVAKARRVPPPAGGGGTLRSPQRPQRATTPAPTAPRADPVHRRARPAPRREAFVAKPRATARREAFQPAPVTAAAAAAVTPAPTPEFAFEAPRDATAGTSGRTPGRQDADGAGEFGFEG